VDLAEYKARRPRQEQTNLLLLAFVASLIAHILFALAWEFRAHLPHLAWLDWMKKQSAKLDPAALLLKLDQPKPLPPELLKIAALRPPLTEQPMPQLTFVDVDPALASEPPKDAKFYSATSTRAANPEAKIESNVPKIDGKQTQMVKVQDVPKPLPPASPPPAPQPKASPPPPKAETTPEPKPQPPAPKAATPPTPKPVVAPPPQPAEPPPKPAPTPPPAPAPQPKKSEPQPLQPTPSPTPQVAGETLRPQPKPAPPAPPAPPVSTPAPTQPPVVVQVAKAMPIAPAPTSPPAVNPSTAPPAKATEPGDAETKSTRPRTIKEALARRQESGLVGEKMLQQGGVKRLGVSAMDVQGTSFGAYDQAIVHAIQQRWYDLLETRFSPRGKVVIEFRLHHDGRVTGLKVSDADVGDLYVLLCQKAIQDPAPFPRWPSDMRRQLQDDHRDIRFTFFYH